MTALPLAPALATTYPEIETATRLFRHWNTPLVSYEDQAFYEEDLLYTDSAFFEVFGFELLRGDPSALSEPRSLLITESTADKYFGDEEPVGKTLRINARLDFTVRGVLADPPSASHLSFDFLGSVSSLPEIAWPSVLEDWDLNNSPTYVVLRPGTDPRRLEEKLVDFVIDRFGEDAQSRYVLQPLVDIHLHSDFRNELFANSDVRYVYLLAGIALIILLLACINYTNLATAQLVERIREIGIRKALGGQRRQLVTQFVAESLVLVSAAVICALVLAQFLLGPLGLLTRTSLTFGDVLVPGLVLIAAVVAGVLAGSYPALYLSGLTPTNVMSGGLRGLRRARLRRTLVVVQYGLAFVLVVATAAIYKQLAFIQTMDVGFDAEQLVVLRVRDPELQQQPERIKEAFRRVAGVGNVATSSSVPGTSTASTTLTREGSEEAFTLFMYWIDHEYIETMGAEMLAGRSFSLDYPSDSAGTVLLNESAAREMGWVSPADAVGQTVRVWEEDHNVVGVVRDFHFESLHEPIKPLLFFPEFEQAGGVFLRVASADLGDALTRLEAAWRSMSAAQPFTYSLLDQNLERLYETDRRTGRVISTATVLAVLIACLGMFGLAALAAEQRTKEIGVRKVLGASVGGILLLFSRDFAVLVVVAVLAGTPVAYLVVSRWLEEFSYRTSIGPGLFVGSATLVLVISMVAISYQAVRAAMTDPVNSLRYE